MMLYSERNSNKPNRNALQINSFDENTNRKLWDLISWLIKIVANKKISESNDKLIEKLNMFFVRFNSNVLKKLVEDVNNLYDKPGDDWNGYYYDLRTQEYSSLRIWWFDEDTLFDNKLDMLELLCLCLYQPKVNELINKKLEQLSIGYRVNSKNQIMRTSSDEELESIEQADKETTHINKAVTLLKNGDYPNSVKESILAVEDICKKFLGDNAKNTLGKNLTIIKKRSDFHPAFIEILEKLYFTSCNAKNVRHIGNDLSAIEQEEAHFILITCSAFINYLKEKERMSSK